MGHCRGAVSSRAWSSLLGKTLGALALSTAVLVPIEVLGVGPADAAPTISFLSTGNLSTGASSTTLSGTVFVDAGVTPTPGSHIVQLEYEVFPATYPNCSPPPGPCSPTAIATGLPAVKPTLFGWLGEWNTTNTLNGTYDLVVFAEDVDNATGTVYSSATSAPMTVTVTNPAPAVREIIPSNNATMSGTQILDAVASPNVYEVLFYLTGGSLTAADVLAGTPTIYGWVAQLNTATVPDGTYALQSVTSYLDGLTAASTSLTVTVDNAPLQTQLLLPKGGSDISGNVVFDATAQGANVTGVSFVVTFGPLSDYKFLTATPTYFGWVGAWNSLACPPGYPNGSYVFQSVVTQAGGATAMSAPVDVTLNNTGGCP
jgi:hypothetical protein